MNRTDFTAAAIDLGASSGRVILGRLAGGELSLELVNRFANTPIDLPDGLHWDLVGLYSSALDGLRQAVSGGSQIDSVGIDTWAVDYGLLAGNRLVGLPYNYRDPRSQRGVAAVHAAISPAELYGRTGLQFLPFNTLYQLASETPVGLGADKLLLIPDLLAFWLTGVGVSEATNASSTGLLDPRTRTWDTELIRRIGLPPGLFAPVVNPGTVLGGFRDPVIEAVGADLQVVAVATHDTASAVAAVPMDPSKAAYISCGTWGLVGVELPAPVLTEAARAANFTNEGGVDGTTRFLHNVMGLWILSETLRTWEARGGAADLRTLLSAAAEVPAPQALFDVNDDRFLAPGDMPTRILEWLSERGLPLPASDVGIVRLIVESLAEAFAVAVRHAERLSGVRVEQIHVVGGGCQNSLLCQLTADRSGLPVLAGPVEATAAGNVLIQARARGLGGTLEALRQVVASSFSPELFEPRRRGWR